ncbi:MAG: Spy/CpxP family protein refolding chaperone [Acidobacteria bacterium]|nr:Spy/CpxP family protein refolding chaperone [Acidobacteriota bacterium]
MKTNHFVLIALAILTLGLLSFAVLASPGQDARFRRPFPRPSHHRAIPAEWREKLGLNEEQEQRLRELELKTRKAAIQAGANLRSHRLELEQLLLAESPDRSAIDQKIKEMSEARSALMRNRIEHRLSLRGILTPEQLEKLAKLKSELAERRSERRMERMHPGRPGSAGPFAGPLPPDDRPPAPPNMER